MRDSTKITVRGSAGQRRELAVVTVTSIPVSPSS
jgi:hypothetical protein